MTLTRRPTTPDELIDAVYVTRVSLEVVPGILKDVETALRDALAEESKAVDRLREGFKTAKGLPRPGNLKDLVELPSGAPHFAEATRRLRDAQSHLTARLKDVRSGLALLERELGQRRRPGRPSELTGSELAVAKYEREHGKSWTQVHRSLNALRRELNEIRGGTTAPPPIPLTTLRTALEPRHAKKVRR